MKKFIFLLSLGFFTVNTSFLQAQALPDSSFSIWKHNANPAYDDPNPVPLTGNGWQDVNIVSSPIWGSSPVSVFKDSINYNSPPYSAKIVSVVLNSLTMGLLGHKLGYLDTLGIMFLGTGTNVAWPFTMGYPYTGRPSVLDFYYEYAPSGNDTGLAEVMLTKWNTNKNREDTVATGTFLMRTPVAIFTKGQVLLKYTPAYLSSGNPDTAQVFFSAANIIHPNQAKPGTTLWVDDVKWSNIPTNIPDLNSLSSSATVFPNPSQGLFSIQWAAPSTRGWAVEVYNVLGQKVYSAPAQPSPTPWVKTAGSVYFSYNINLSSQPNGIYFYRVLGESGRLIGQGKVIVQK